MANEWEKEFRKRLDSFALKSSGDVIPISIKLRPIEGCFHREHSPNAYSLIDFQIEKLSGRDQEFHFEEHESGPEIFAYLAALAAGLGLSKAVIELVTAVIKARSEGRKKGDTKSSPLTLIVRGFSKDGEYFEETILQIPNGQGVDQKLIEMALESGTKKLRKAKRTKKKAAPVHRKA